MQKKKEKNGTIKYIVAAVLLIVGYGWFYHSNKQLQKTLEETEVECEIAEDMLAHFQLPYPEQQLIDTALAAEIKHLPADYKLHLKQTADSIMALVAKKQKNQTLEPELRQAISSFKEDDYMRCFWYRWGHKDILGPHQVLAGDVFPYTALDSLACVLLYPTVFND